MEETDVNMMNKEQVGCVSWIQGPRRCETGSVGLEEGVAASNNAAREGWRRGEPAVLISEGETRGQEGAGQRQSGGSPAGVFWEFD